MEIKINVNQKKEYKRIINFINKENIDCVVNINSTQKKESLSFEELFKIREKCLIAHMGKNKYQLLREYQNLLRRGRFLLIKNVPSEIIIDSEDIRIVDKFQDSIELPIGRGYNYLLLHLINYYKTEKKLSNN